MVNKSIAGARKGSTGVIGAKTSGVTQKVASTVDKKVKSAFLSDGKLVTIKGTRYIPSTKVFLAKDLFEVMANTVIEVASIDSTDKSVKSIDSVVTVGRENNSQVLKNFNIPSLEKIVF